MKSGLVRLLGILGLALVLIAIPRFSEASLRTSSVGRLVEVHRYLPGHPNAGSYSVVLYFDANNDGSTDQFLHSGPACGQQAPTLGAFDQGKLMDAVASGLRVRLDYLPIASGGLTLNCVVGYSVLP